MKRVYREHFVAIFLFSVLTLAMTFPVIFHMTSSVAGTGGDPWQTMWRFQEKSNLFQNTAGFQDALVRIGNEFLGTGDPALTNISVWPWMLFHMLFGEPLAYNLVWLIHFVLAGYAMALFITVLTNRSSILESAPILSGIAYMFLPYRIAQGLGHFGAMQLEWIPLISLTALLFFRSPTIWRSILLGLLLTVQAWTEHHYIVWVALFGLLVWFVYRNEFREYSFFNIKDTKRRTSLVILVAIAIIGILLPFIPTIRLATTQRDALVLGVTQTMRFSADLFSFITPASTQPMWGSISYALFGKYFTGNDAESIQYVGISILLAILFFHRHIPVRQKRLWIATILLFGVISLGPVLHVFGRDTGIPLPYALLVHLPVFSAIRVISRAGVMVGFATVVLFGWVLATNVHRTRTSIVIGGAILLEFLFFPFPIQSTTLSPVYDAIQSVPGSSVIEIPAATNYTAASRSLYASSLHGKNPIGNIALERGENQDAYDLPKSLPALRQLLYLRTTDLVEGRNEFFTQNLAEAIPDAMKYVDARAIVVHTDSLSALQNTAIDEFLVRTKLFTKQSFGDAVLYTIKPSPETTSDGIVITRNDGWENVGYDPKKDSVFGEVSSTARIDVLNVLDHPIPIELSYIRPGESQSGVLLKDAKGNELQTYESNGRIVIPITAQPGTTPVYFLHDNTAGKAIIQDPDYTVRRDL